MDDIFRGVKNLSVKSSNFGSRPAATVLPGNKTEALMVIRKLTVTAAIFFSFLSLLFFFFSQLLALVPAEATAVGIKGRGVGTSPLRSPK